MRRNIIRKTRKQTQRNKRKTRNQKKYRGGMNGATSSINKWVTPAAPAAPPVTSKNETMYSDPTGGIKSGRITNKDYPFRSPTVINDLPVINYIISSHGVKPEISLKTGLLYSFIVPTNVEIVFYTPHDNPLYCTTQNQAQVCSGVAETAVYERFTEGMPCVNYQLHNDPTFSFKSGVVDCSTNERIIVFNLDTFKYARSSITQVLEALSPYHQKNHPGTFARIHCLFCRDT